jgi:hypothetical protein
MIVKTLGDGVVLVVVGEVAVIVVVVVVMELCPVCIKSILQHVQS